MVILGLILALMLAGHAVADTWLQPPWLSGAKRDPRWATAALALHGTCHGFFVGLATGSWQLALAEAVVHPCIDNLKARGWYGIRVDQALHVLCKLAWILVLWHTQ